MAKKKKSNKKLRREVEALRAQLKASAQPDSTGTSTINLNKSPKQSLSIPSSITVIDPKLFKRDLIKTFALSVIAFAIILGLWLKG